jgi:NAD(P)-dependent dehydrogenase (short-subunit alcohol dehydrogenase family)
VEKNHKSILISASTSALAGALIETARLRRDYNVLTVSRTEPESIRSDGFLTYHHVSGIDLTDPSCIKTVAEVAMNFFHQPFTAVHFAGDFWHHKPLLTTDFTEIRAMINSHFLTLCGLAQSVTPTMAHLGGGRLIAFSCNSVSHNYPDMSPFTAAKAAIETFIQCYANEHAPFGIAATALALPTMKTPEVLKEKTTGDHANYICPEELAEFILDSVIQQPLISTGNVIRVFKHSPTFYGQGYFERNPRKVEDNNAMQRIAEKARAR